MDANKKGNAVGINANVGEGSRMGSSSAPSIGRVRAACGHAADATRETMLSTIFHSEVRGAVVALMGPTSAAWIREPGQSSVLGRAWGNGESVWMAAHDLAMRFYGARLAHDEDGERRVIRNAWKSAKGGQ